MKETADKPAALVLDNPDHDATDFAHPAWWRGNDEGVKRTVQIVNEILDGNHSRGRFADASLDLLRSRLTNAALPFLPIAGEGKVKALTKTQIETLANNIHNSDDYAYTIECLTYHLSTPPSSPGKDGGQEDDRTEGFIAGYDEGLRQSKNEASISTTDALEKAKAVLKTIRRGALAPMGDVIAALTALDNALEAAPSKETDQ